MELSIKPYHKNLFPLSGMLVRGASPAAWIREIQSAGLSAGSVQLYPIPGAEAASIWGCFVLTEGAVAPSPGGGYELCQKISPSLYIPQYATIWPWLSAADIDELIGEAPCIMHPDFGFVVLREAIDPAALISTPAERSFYVTRPYLPRAVPQQVRILRVQPVDPAEALKNLEKNLFPQQEPLKDKPLNAWEKLKFRLYRWLLGKAPKAGAATGGGGRPGLLQRLLSLITGRAGTKWLQQMNEDYEDLEFRNKQELEKLIDMLRDNPAQALKYAIPLDTIGASRGPANGRFSLWQRWSDFSLFSSGGGSAGPAVSIGDQSHELRKQYLETADSLVRQRDYHKAAFVYLKLLKDPYSAAQTLEAGACYQDAATIYLEHLQNKEKGAECYEKGMMTMQAIELYKEMGRNEKVGDLYVTIQKRKEANFYYGKVAADYRNNRQFVKAALIYRNKINDPAAGQAMLLEGWEQNKDAFNCLNNYFRNIADLKELGGEISRIHQELKPAQQFDFLQCLKYEYARKNELAAPVKEMAYEIISAQAQQNPAIVRELTAFNKTDSELVKDVIRFKIGNKE